MQAVLSRVISSTRLDEARLLHQLLAIHDLDAFALQAQTARAVQWHRRPDGSSSRPRSSSSTRILCATSSARPAAGSIAPRWVEMPARDALAQPGTVELVVSRRRAEVPEDRIVVLRQQREARQLIHRPGADVGGGDVADVVHVEAEERAKFGLFEQPLDARQALACAAARSRHALPSPHPSGRMSSSAIVCSFAGILDVSASGNYQTRPQSVFAISVTVSAVGTV